MEDKHMLKNSPNGYCKKKILEILDIPEISSALDKYHYNNATFLKLYFEVIDRYDYSIYLLKKFEEFLNDAINDECGNNHDYVNLLNLRFSDFQRANQLYNLNVPEYKINKLRLNISNYYDIESRSFINGKSEKDILNEFNDYYLFSEFEEYLLIKFLKDNLSDSNTISKCFKSLHDAQKKININSTSVPADCIGDYYPNEIINDIENINSNNGIDTEVRATLELVIKVLKYPEENFRVDLDELADKIKRLTGNKYEDLINKIINKRTVLLRLGEYNEKTGITLYLKNIANLAKSSEEMDNYIDAVLVHEMFHAFNACSGELYYIKRLVYESLASYVEKTFMYDVKDDIQHSKKLESWWKNNSVRSNLYAGAKLLNDDNFYDIFIKSLDNVDDAYNDLINNIHN